MRSLRFRITLIMILMGIVPAIIIENSIVTGYENRAVSQRSVIVKNQCDIVADQLSAMDYFNKPDNEVVNGKFNVLTGIYGGRILVINKDFKIIRDTYGLDEGKYVVSRDVINCFNGEETSHYDDSNQYIEMTVRIFDDSTVKQEIIGVMLVSVSTVEINTSKDVLQKRGMFVLLLCVCGILIIGLVLSYILVKPFEKITDAISDMTEDYWQDRIEVKDYSETELICDALNLLMTRARTLDESREAFVSNVSHELRTPMTSIKVLADSLNSQENVPLEQYKEFMKDISEEIDRENSIISDLLALVKLDRKSPDLNISQVSINNLLELVIKRLRPIAARQKVELISESFRPVQAEVDETKLTLAFSNLIENAIKYNKPEGGWVRISLNADLKYFYVTVADSGIGIPEDSINHIFERFYRVDKSHSREIGGTGLGLAITRGCIAMHRGAIRVSSKEHEGSTFSVRIPLIYLA